ncbi:ATP-grasp domain-containing protein [bacterium]|nr:ATP-grasp domain-containing protein [bacterium]
MKRELNQHKVFIANRGEVVSRLCKTLKKLNIESVGLACKEDLSQYTKHLDEVIWIEAKAMQTVFTDAKAMITHAKSQDCTAIHPGWGFLSENADFAQACKDNGIVFIGPKPSSIRAFADKAKAKSIAIDAGLSVLHSVDEANFEHTESFIDAIKKTLSLPIILKPALGGGGKGMTIVRDINELKEAVASAKRVAQAAFADASLLAEPYLEKARHVEVQVFSTGEKAYHFKTRDCTMQRRYQKIIEESHSTFLDDEQEAQVCQQAVDLVESIGYESLGTVEFIIDQNKKAYFMEMNTRLQVEHGVTELIFALDLVELQVKHALGETVTLAEDLKPNGHAIEVRVYAENTLKDFVPANGQVRAIEFSSSIDRIECDVAKGTMVGNNFDPMIAKVLVWSESRDQAISKMLQMLKDSYILGVQNNMNFVQWLLTANDFVDGKHDIQWIDRHYQDYVKYEASYFETQAIYNLIYSVEHLAEDKNHNPWYHNSLPSNLPARDQAQNLYKTAMNELLPYPQQLEKLPLTKTHQEHVFSLANGDKLIMIAANNALYLHIDGKQITLKKAQRLQSEDEDAALNHCKAPLNGLVKAVFTEKGQSVKKNDVLLTIEAMKMEYKILAPRDAVIKKVMVQENQQVNEEQHLLELE